MSGAAPITLGTTEINFPCEGPNTFNFPQGGGTFNLATGGPTAVPAGTYRVHAAFDRFPPEGAPAAFDSAALLTVTPPTGGGTVTLSGVARCNVPPLTLIPNAVVSIFSGRALLTTVNADVRGVWSVSGVGANAPLTVRYASPVSGAAAALTCGVGVTTGGDGTTVVPDPSTCPNPTHRSNRVWDDALDVTPAPNGTQVVDSICNANESRWFRVSVLPGQRVTAEIDDPSFDLTLGLYKDIQQISDSMQAAAANGLTLDELQSLTAGLPKDVAAPDATSPDATSPDATSPDATSPDATSPDATSPDATSPDATSPDATSPDATSPDATSPDATSGSYSAALATALIAFSDSPGNSPEFVRRHTWDNTGNFYIRVRGHNGAFDEAHPFGLRITVVNHNCTFADGNPIHLTTTPFSEFALPSVLPRTLILTNTGTGRFATGASTAAMLASLQAFAARPEINGLVVDLALNPGIQADYAQWDQVPQCAPAANIIADQIHGLISVYNSAVPGGLRNVVLAGGDRVLPFQRIVDTSGLSNETNYSPAVFDASESQAVLQTGYFLSQDLYGSFHQIPRLDHTFSAFDVPVGRLVENPTEIQAMLAAYTTAGGVITPSSALVTGYDFLADSAAVQQRDLTEGRLQVNALIQPEGDGPLAQSAWTADDLRSRLLGANHFDIMAINAHFSGNTLLASDMVSHMRSAEIAGVTDNRFLNTLVMSMGCHSGYNIVDPDATAGTPPVDWSQAFNAQGATVIGGTGFQYGNTPLIKYTEVLLDSVTHELRLFDQGTTPGPVPLGQAIVNAKRAYVRGGMNGIDEKSVAELTLYGLPMMSVNIPAAGRIARPAPAGAVSVVPGTSGQLFTADLSPSYSLTGHDRVLNVAGTPSATTTATYFDATYAGATGDTQTDSQKPVLPRVINSAAANGVVARGVVLLDANYTDVTRSLNNANDFRPLVDAPATDVRAIRPPFASSVFAPSRLVSLAEFSGQSLVLTPFQFRSTTTPGGGLSVFGTGRRFDSMSTRVYYSNRLDASALGGPPIIYSTVLTKDPNNSNILKIDVSLGGLSTEGVEDVFATFTADPTPTNPFYGHWHSIHLTKSSNVDNGIGFIRHYKGTIDTTGTGATVPMLQLFVQAVSGTGLVSLATNNGAYYRFVRETTTLSTPKAPTALSFDNPGGFTATYRSSLAVAATLTNQRTGAPIAGRSVTFTLGLSSNTSTTDSNGHATATLPVLVAPDQPPPQVRGGFAEDLDFLASGDQRDVTVTRARTFFTPSTGSVTYGSATIIATLNVDLPGGSRPLREIGVRLTLTDGRTFDTMTDGFGRVLFDTLDFGGVQPGVSPNNVSFAGNDRYLPSSLALSETVQPGTNRSLALNGTNGYAETPSTPDLNITGNWTVETWFKDNDPNGFNHEPRQIINKGDRAVNGESPYFILVGNNNIVAGVRTNGVDYPISWSLTYQGLDPKAWHHVAVTFRADLNVLNLWLDGQHITFFQVPTHSTVGNSLPVQIGRNGPVGGKYWQGELDDLRIWNIARTGTDISATFRSELSSAPTGLVANWKFNERPGTLQAFSNGGTHTATLSTTGAAFVPDVHP